MILLPATDARRRDAEPRLEEAEIEPLRHFGKRLSAQLGVGVGRDDAAGIRERRHAPQRDPSHESGLSHAVTGRRRVQVGGNGPLLIPSLKVVPHAREHVHLPHVRTVPSGEGIFAPREGNLDELQRVL